MRALTKQLRGEPLGAETSINKLHRANLEIDVRQDHMASVAHVKTPGGELHGAGLHSARSVVLSSAASRPWSWPIEQ